MKNALTNGFPPFLTETNLRSAVESVCSEFGKVAYLRILAANRVSRLECGCLLRLDSADAEIRLKSKLKVVEFAGYIGFTAVVDETWAGPRTQV
jgi:hypothetical protein